MNQTVLITLSILSISLSLISCSKKNFEPDFQTLIISKPIWLEVKSDSIFIDEKVVEFVDISNITNQSFKKPSIVRVKKSYISQQDKVKTKDDIVISLVECWNFRSAIISWNEVFLCQIKKQ